MKSASQSTPLRNVCLHLEIIESPEQTLIHFWLGEGGWRGGGGEVGVSGGGRGVLTLACAPSFLYIALFLLLLLGLVYVYVQCLVWPVCFPWCLNIFRSAVTVFFQTPLPFTIRYFHSLSFSVSVCLSLTLSLFLSAPPIPRIRFLLDVLMPTPHTFSSTLTNILL